MVRSLVLRSCQPSPTPLIVNQPGDLVAVQHTSGRREGLVVGSHIDYAVRALPRTPAPPVPAADVWCMIVPYNFSRSRCLRAFRAGKSSRSSSTPERSTTRGTF